MVFEKLGFMETHFIDVREELSKKFNAKYQEINDQLASAKLELTEYTDSQIAELGFGPAQINLVKMLTQEWQAHEQKFSELCAKSKTVFTDFESA